MKNNSHIFETKMVVLHVIITFFFNCFDQNNLNFDQNTIRRVKFLYFSIFYKFYRFRWMTNIKIKLIIKNMHVLNQRHLNKYSSLSKQICMDIFSTLINMTLII